QSRSDFKPMAGPYLSAVNRGPIRGASIIHGHETAWDRSAGLPVCTLCPSTCRINTWARRSVTIVTCNPGRLCSPEPLDRSTHSANSHRGKKIQCSSETTASPLYQVAYFLIFGPDL